MIEQVDLIRMKMISTLNRIREIYGYCFNLMNKRKKESQKEKESYENKLVYSSMTTIQYLLLYKSNKIHH